MQVATILIGGYFAFVYVGHCNERDNWQLQLVAAVVIVAHFVQSHRSPRSDPILKKHEITIFDLVPTADANQRDCKIANKRQRRDSWKQNPSVQKVGGHF